VKPRPLCTVCGNFIEFTERRMETKTHGIMHVPCVQSMYPSLLEYNPVIKEMKNHDPVNHPSHYTSHPSGIECIQVTRHMTFNIGNAMKYLWRADHKDATIQDLEKAVWYIKDEIKRIKDLTPKAVVGPEQEGGKK